MTSLSISNNITTSYLQTVELPPVGIMNEDGEDADQHGAITSLYDLSSQF